MHLSVSLVFVLRCSVSGACFLKGFVLHSVPDPPRKRKASVTHDPKRVMCYERAPRGSGEGAFRYFLHDPKRVMCYGQPLRASWNQCQAMLSNAHQCKAIQPFPHVFCELSRRIYAVSFALVLSKDH